MSVYDFLTQLFASSPALAIMGTLLVLLVALGVYKFVKDWLPW